MRVALIATIHLAGCGDDCDIGEAARAYAGSGAQNCGTFKVDEVRDDGMRCAVAAFEERRAFIVIFEERGIDSTVRRAWAGNAKGDVVILLYDSDPSGGDETGAVVDQMTCIEPHRAQAQGQSPMHTDGSDVLECTSAGTLQRICG